MKFLCSGKKKKKRKEGRKFLFILTQKGCPMIVLVNRTVVVKVFFSYPVFFFSFS